MSHRLIAACIQTNAGPEIAENLERIAPLIHEARHKGAEFIALPENVSLMICGRERLFARARSEAEHPAIPFFQHMARETGTWILGGSLGIVTGEERLANRSYMFSPQGEIVAYYDKIHMYDADPCDGESYRESSNYRPGDRAVTADTPWGKIGMTICYDVRFPYLFRTLAKAGCSIITVPAAFAAPTGAHWEILLRARAIETGSYIIAPAQCGMHDSGRRTFGHSLIINPWGEILAQAGNEVGVITAEIDLDFSQKVRTRLPSLQHDREFAAP